MAFLTMRSGEQDDDEMWWGRSNRQTDATAMKSCSVKWWFGLAALLLGSFATDALLAETLSKSVPSGRPSKLDHYTGWNDDCSFKEIKVDPVSRPAHGSVSVRIASGRISDTAQIGSSGACAGRPTKVLELYYTPERGYHGPDALRVELRVGGSSPAMFDYEIDVQ